MGAFTRLPRAPFHAAMRLTTAVALAAGIGALALPTAASATAITVQAELQYTDSSNVVHTLLLPSTSAGIANEISQPFSGF